MTNKQSQAKIVRSGIAGVETLQQQDLMAGLGEVARESSTLDDDVWRLVDGELVSVMRERAVFPEILARHGVSKEVGNFGQRRMDVWDMEESLAGTTELGLGPVKAGTSLRKRNSVPILSTYCDVQVDPLDLEAAKHGLMEPLDALGLREAMEIVADLRNKLIAAGSSDEGLDGILNRTSRQSFTGADWTTAGNFLVDARGMDRRLFDKNVPEGTKRVLFVSGTNYEEAAKELSSTARSQLEQAKEAGYYDEIVRTLRRSTGTATMVAFSPSWIRHRIFQAVKVSELGSLGMSPVFRVWGRETLYNAKPDTVIDATSI